MTPVPSYKRLPQLRRSSQTFRNPHCQQRVARLPAVELWETERNALNLMREAFRRDVRVESTAAPDEAGFPSI
jgi:hypothetical protein